MKRDSMKYSIVLLIGIIAVLLVSGCTQMGTGNGGTAKQISMENLIAAGNIKIDGNRR